MLKGGEEQMVVSPGAFATALEKVDKKLTNYNCIGIVACKVPCSHGNR